MECLVALAVAAIALAALVGAASGQAEAVAYQRDRTLATWVAANAIAEIRLQRAFPRVGSRSGQSSMGDRVWYWSMDIAETPEPALRRLDVVVTRTAGDDAAIASLTAFVGRQGGESAP